MKQADTLGPRSSQVLIRRATLESNWNLLTSQMSPPIRLLPMVKANAYGHGDIIVAQECLRLGGIGVGVADIGEAMSLRRQGYKGLILSFGPIFSQGLLAAMENDVVIVLHSYEEVECLEMALRSATKHLRIHVEIETGMNRLGLDSSAWAKTLERLIAFDHVVVEGVFTHLAESENSDKSFTQMQIKIFLKAVDVFEKYLGRRLIRHAANSGGILSHPSSHFDWVRPGIALYGYPACNQQHTSSLKPSFQPILEWRAPIIQVKRIAPGDCVGYNRGFRATSAKIIGTVAVGYGDGYRRGFSRAGVGYQGRRCPIVGLVCMDLLMIDVTDIPQVHVNDEVALLGPGESSEPTAYELAQVSQTIPYEVVTGINAQVTRALV